MDKVHNHMDIIIPIIQITRTKIKKFRYENSKYINSVYRESTAVDLALVFWLKSVIAIASENVLISVLSFDILRVNVKSTSC